MYSNQPSRPTPPFTIVVITLIPKIWPYLLQNKDAGLISRAFIKKEETPQEALPQKAELYIYDLRLHGVGPHKKVDDTPYGGGAGMILQVPPVHQAIVQAKKLTQGPVIVLAPRGKRFDQSQAKRLAEQPGLIIVAGRYEGFDERVYHYADEIISIGDFILSAGDPAAWCLIDSVVRLLPGVIGNAQSLSEESFTPDAQTSPLLEYPQYTRPLEYDEERVPTVLTQGDHQAIKEWRKREAAALTKKYRPDLLKI